MLIEGKTDMFHTKVLFVYVKLQYINIIV